jgi:acetyl-CoA carboxylase carboxyltransferase component
VVIDAVFDDDSFRNAPDYGRSRIIGLARAGGYPAGVMLNNPMQWWLHGCSRSREAARLVQLCDTFHLPLILLVDDPGFMVGPDSERQGLNELVPG